MPANKKYNSLLRRQKLRGVNVSAGTGLDTQAVSTWRKGRSNFTLRRIRILCEFHKCTPNDIIDYEGWDIVAPSPPQNP